MDPIPMVSKPLMCSLFPFNTPPPPISPLFLPSFAPDRFLPFKKILTVRGVFSWKGFYSFLLKASNYKCINMTGFLILEFTSPANEHKYHHFLGAPTWVRENDTPVVPCFLFPPLATVAAAWPGSPFGP